MTPEQPAPRIRFTQTWRAGIVSASACSRVYLGQAQQLPYPERNVQLPFLSRLMPIAF